LAAKYHLPGTETDYKAYSKKIKTIYCLACPVGDSQSCIEDSMYPTGLYGLTDLRKHIAAAHTKHADGTLDQSAFDEKYRDGNPYEEPLSTDDISSDDKDELPSRETNCTPSQTGFDDEDLFGPEP
jgi:hypothetical protein